MNAVKDGYVKHNGKEHIQKTIRGVKLLIACFVGKDKNGKDLFDKTWVPLSTMKQSHPLQVAEFVVARGYENLPAFAWWVKETLRKRNTIIAAVKKRVLRIHTSIVSRS